MAITSAVNQVAKVILEHPFVITETGITLTADGTLKVLAIAGTKHGGPSGATPLFAYFMQTLDSATTQDLVQFIVTNYDTTNNEVDYSVFFSDLSGGATANTETVKYKMYTVFSSYASGRGTV